MTTTQSQSKSRPQPRGNNAVVVVLLGLCLTALPLVGQRGTNHPSPSSRPDLEYLKALKFLLFSAKVGEQIPPIRSGN